MAGRFVVIEVDTPEQADEIMRDAQITTASAKIVGLYLRPNKYCSHRDKPSNQAANWKRHKKYFMFVCRRCGLPSRYHYLGIGERLKVALGTNLLPGEGDDG